MKRLQLKEPKEFANAFLERFLERGFGTMSKKEIELLVLELLEKHEHFSELSNHAAALQLGFSEMRLRSLRYELAQQSYGHDRDYFARKLLPCLSKLQFAAEKENGGATLTFAIEDKFVRLSLSAKLKEQGNFTDTSFNSELVRVDADKLCKALKSIYEQKDCAAILDKIENLLKDLNKIKFEELWRRFVTSAM